MTVNEPPVIDSVSLLPVVMLCIWMLPDWMVMVAAEDVSMMAVSPAPGA